MRITYQLLSVISAVLFLFSCSPSHNCQTDSQKSAISPTPVRNENVRRLQNLVLQSLSSSESPGSVPISSFQDLNNTSIEISTLIKNLENGYTADDAYIYLCMSGKDAIPYLIENASNTAIFPGQADVNPLSSFIGSREESVGVISLYIVECIRKGDFYPHRNAIIVESGQIQKSAKTVERIRLDAIKAYEDWWQRNKDTALDQIILRDDSPFKKTPLTWL